MKRAWELSAVGILIILFGYTGVLTYWWFSPEIPMVIEYTHPKLLSSPAKNREEAERYEVDEVLSGAKVYQYNEYCLKTGYDGVVKQAWENTEIRFLPDRQTLGRTGCVKNSFTVNVPPGMHGKAIYHKRIIYKANPIKDVTVFIRDTKVIIKESP